MNEDMISEKITKCGEMSNYMTERVKSGQNCGIYNVCSEIKCPFFCENVIPISALFQKVYVFYSNVTFTMYCLNGGH